MTGKPNPAENAVANARAREAADWLMIHRLEERVRQAEAAVTSAQMRLEDAQRLLRLARAGALRESDAAGGMGGA